jgi:hypothetical protein
MLVLESFIVQRAKKIKEDFPFPDDDLIVSAGSIRDLTKLDGGPNLFSTGYDYNLTTDNLEEESQRLISYTCGLSIAQGYEVLETYLKNVLSSVCFENDLHRIFRIDESNDSFSSIREEIRRLQGRNNRGLLKILRRISQSYVKYEKQNLKGFELNVWFDLISTIRHDIVHNRHIVSKELLKLLTEPKKNEIFSRYCELRELKLGTTIFFSYQNARELIHVYEEFAYLIYKMLSEKFGLGSLNWEMHLND